MKTENSGSRPGQSTQTQAPDGNFQAVAQSVEADLISTIEDSVADGHVTSLEAAINQEKFQVYKQGFDAHVRAQKAYDDARAKAEDNLKA